MTGSRPAGSDARADADTDLFGLAQTVAALTRGMVSIEDDRSLVLAYSASDDAADELRRLSILGREGPADYLRRLRERGVFDRLRQHRRAWSRCPPTPELGTPAPAGGQHPRAGLDELGRRRDAAPCARDDLGAGGPAAAGRATPRRSCAAPRRSPAG